MSNRNASQALLGLRLSGEFHDMDTSPSTTRERESSQPSSQASSPLSSAPSELHEPWEIDEDMKEPVWRSGFEFASQIIPDASGDKLPVTVEGVQDPPFEKAFRHSAAANHFEDIVPIASAPARHEDAETESLQQKAMHISEEVPPVIATKMQDDNFVMTPELLEWQNLRPSRARNAPARYGIHDSRPSASKKPKTAYDERCKAQDSQDEAFAKSRKQSNGLAVRGNRVAAIGRRDSLDSDSTRKRKRYRERKIEDTTKGQRKRPSSSDTISSDDEYAQDEDRQRTSRSRSHDRRTRGRGTKVKNLEIGESRSDRIVDVSRFQDPNAVEAQAKHASSYLSPHHSPEEAPPTVPLTPIDPDLLDMSLLLTKRVPIEAKPMPQGRPEVSATERACLCESLPGIYEAYNGAFYGKDGVPNAFMLDGNGHSRDYMDENVIILRAGGSMIKSKKTKMMVQCKDQTENGQTRSIRNAISQQIPIVVFCGSSNDMVSTKMPYRYNSLAWFKPTTVWNEYVEGEDESGQPCSFKTIKYRLEKLEDKPSWWAPADSRLLLDLGVLDTPVLAQCCSCKTEHQQVYLQGWMCLTPSCRRFWTLQDGSTPEVLSHDPRFIKQKTAWISEQAPHAIRPAPPEPLAEAGDGYRYKCTRGMCCPQCGHCESRFRWEGWVCTQCNYEFMPPHSIIPAAAIIDQKHPVSRGPARSINYVDPAVKTTVEIDHNHRWMKYEIEGLNASVIHGIANQTVREEPQGPNDMWEVMQTTDLGLERRRLRTAGGASRMSAFSVNFGWPYKFIAAVASRPFKGSPWPVRSALARLRWAAELKTHPNAADDVQFNEEYVVGYFEGQEMDYHDDGEEGLGPTVATLSLGAPAEMFFRPKSKYYYGVSDRGVYMDTDDELKRLFPITESSRRSTANDKPAPPLSHFDLYDERMAALQQLKICQSEEEYKRKMQNMPKELCLKYKGTTKPWMRLWLGHGDIVIMRGSAFQRYFEHAVTPKGLLRFAMTCRTILKHHVPSDQWPKDDVDPDDEVKYDGEGIKDWLQT